MDQAILLWLNSWNGTTDFQINLQNFIHLHHFRVLPPILLLWYLWFREKSPETRTPMRENLVTVILLSLIIIGVTRAITRMLPFSHRPVHTEGLDLILLPGNENILVGWSSMPSDHASLMLGMAFALFLIDRRWGLFLIFWAIFFVSLPRVVQGLHWPSDILVGWLVGIATVLVFRKPLHWLVQKTGIVPFFEKREALGYPLLFLVTFEMGSMFQLAQFVTAAIID